MQWHKHTAIAVLILSVGAAIYNLLTGIFYWVIYPILAGLSFWLVLIGIKYFYIYINQIRSSNLDITSKSNQVQFEHAAMALTLRQMSLSMVYPNALGNIGINHHTKPDTPLLLPETVTEEKIPLLSVLEGKANILIVGGKGSGKTTLLQRLNLLRQDKGDKVVILDSHNHPTKWAGSPYVIGNGRNYGEIWESMMDLVNLLNERYKDYSSGVIKERQFPPIVNLVDEFTLLPTVFGQQGKNVQDYSIPLLTEGRKVSMDLIWGIHSDKVRYMGLKGASDIKECFDAIVYLKNVDGDRYALIDLGEGKDKNTKYSLPEPVFTQSAPPPFYFQEKRISPEKEVSEEESQALIGYHMALQSDKFSWRKATQEAFGEGKFGSGYTKKLQSILDKHNVSY